MAVALTVASPFTSLGPAAAAAAAAAAFRPSLLAVSGDWFGGLGPSTLTRMVLAILKTIRAISSFFICDMFFFSQIILANSISLVFIPRELNFFCTVSDGVKALRPSISISVVFVFVMMLNRCYLLKPKVTISIFYVPDEPGV